MSWLTQTTDAKLSTFPAFGVAPEVSKPFEDVRRIALTLIDRLVLESCLLRLAQVLGCETNLTASRVWLAELERWSTSSTFSQRDRAALAYSEQFLLDPHGITEDHRAELDAHFSRTDVYDLVHGLNLLEAYLRLCAFVDVEADLTLPRDGWTPPAPAATFSFGTARGKAALEAYALTDRAFMQARVEFSRSLQRLTELDDLTKEVVRLRTAQLHDCVY
jgi:alkylhydroperoxidase family enzyme